MSKELVISSNSHETRVAILEDDQLVEVYFQRANEYSLAGSVHKGRVTRVLPGMQSAFVDLGLERDTFLYVSDFLDENGEEYDSVVPEEKVAVVRPVARPEPRVQTVAPIRELLPPPVASAPVPDLSSLAEAEPGASGESKGPDDAERPGRRSRRRRTRGRGFPDSKYAGEVTRDAAPVRAEAPLSDEPSERSEAMLLPGESLAKYTQRPQTTALPHVASLTFSVSEEEADRIVDIDIDELSATVNLPEDGGFDVAELAVETQMALEEPVSLLAVVADGELLILATESVGELSESLEQDEEEEADEPLSAFSDESTAQIEDQVEAAEARLEAAGAFEDEEEKEESEEFEGSEYASNAPGEPPPSTPIGDLDDIAAVPEEEMAEPTLTGPPASQPLSASVRENGGRYPHRQSRRMRRRRGGERPERTEARPETPVVAEVARPERVEKPERPERIEPAERSDRPVMPSISDLLREGQEIIVQIAKEPLGQKGARITSHIALPGRFVVYMPTLEHLGVSRKISTEEERQRLKRILQASRAGLSGGFIVRTAGEGRSEEEIAGDMAYLYNLWLDIRSKAEKRKAPVLLHHDLDIVHRILRDQLSDMFKAIWLDNEEVYESVLRFMQRFQPGLVSRVKLYTRPAPIFDSFGVTSEIEKALRPKVWLKSGGYIVINQTEALVAIDVNTGKFVGKSNRLEDTITKTNTEAVKEIVRQVRLRDLGGIIVIDFIDMDERKNRQKVMQALEDTMRADRAPYKILQFNDFGLVAITRKRVKQSLERALCSPCPVCEGAGFTKSVATVVTEIVQEASKIRQNVDGKNVELRVYPEVAKHLKSSKNSDLEEIEAILSRPVLIVSDSTLHPEKFDIAW